MLIKYLGDKRPANDAVATIMLFFMREKKFF